MKIAIKYLSQFVFIPLIEKLLRTIVNGIKKWNYDRIEKKALEAASRELGRKVEEYENSSPDDAFDSHP